jgi:hypothetical protein
MKVRAALIGTMLLLVFLSSCRPLQLSAHNKEDQPLVDSARQDLASRLHIPQEDIQVLSVEKAQYPDSSLGMPEPGQAYTKAITNGYVIKLLVGETVYEYRACPGRVMLAFEYKRSENAALRTQAVKVEVGKEITFEGRGDLPADACIQSQLFVNDQPLGWWPKNNCGVLTGDGWQIEVPLNKDGAPIALDATGFYKLHVWLKGQPQVDDWFYFDLAGPPHV